MLLTKTGPRCISFRCTITVSLAQGAIHDAEADVADPVFVRSTITESHLLGVCSATDAEQNGVLLGLPPAPTHRHGGRAGGQHPSESKPNRRPVEATNAARWLSFVLATLARDHLVVSAVSKMRNRMAGACVVLQQGLAEGLSSET